MLRELKQNLKGLRKRALDAERQLKVVQNFTNSYSSLAVSRPDNNVSNFDTMMSMLEDIYDKEVIFLI